MAELTAGDVATWTDGRLEDNEETQRMLDAALLVTRRECGWHVSPVITGDVVVLDGPCGRVLMLPTRRLLAPVSVEEDGVTLNLADLRWTGGDLTVFGPGRPAAIRKKNGGCWSCDYESITVTMDHGYTEEQAADWREAICALVDQMSQIPIGASAGGSSGAPDLIRKQVDDVEYQWGTLLTQAQQNLFSVSHVLYGYKLPDVEFM